MRAELSRVSHQTNISWECSRCGCSSPSTRDRLWEKWVRFGCITLKLHVLSIEKPPEEKSCPVLSGTAVLWTSYTTYSCIIWFRCKIFSPASSPQRQWELVLAQEMQKQAADVGWRVGMLLSMVATYVFKAFEKATAWGTADTQVPELCGNFPYSHIMVFT